MKQIIQQQDALFAFEQFCRLTNHHSDDQTKSRLPPYLSETSRTMKSTRPSLVILKLAQAPSCFQIYHQTYLKVETQVSASFSIYKQGPLLSLYSEFDRMRALIYTYVARANDLNSMANDSRDRNR